METSGLASRKALFFLIPIVIIIVIVVALFASNILKPPIMPSPMPTATPTLTPSTTPTQSPPTSGNTTVVVMKDNYYVPANLTIDIGTTVNWTNGGIDIHTTTSYTPGPGGTGYLWNSGILQPGQSYNYTFTQTGTFNYFCGVHPTTMFGQIVVIEPT